MTNKSARTAVFQVTVTPELAALMAGLRAALQTEYRDQVSEAEVLRIALRRLADEMGVIYTHKERGK